jgi:phage tail-like protein
MNRPAGPLHVFRFHVHFLEDPFSGSGGERPLCSGAFSDCTGLEATMEPKVIKEGGANYGPSQRVGPVTFATVVLKRGVTRTRDLWNWFDVVNRSGKYAYRLAAIINMHDSAGEAVLAWRLDRALPVKFKAADLNAKGSEIGIEELHLAHEGLRLVDPSHPSIAEVRP